MLQSRVHKDLDTIELKPPQISSLLLLPFLHLLRLLFILSLNKQLLSILFLLRTWLPGGWTMDCFNFNNPTPIVTCN